MVDASMEWCGVGEKRQRKREGRNYVFMYSK